MQVVLGQIQRSLQQRERSSGARSAEAAFAALDVDAASQAVTGGGSAPPSGPSSWAVSDEDSDVSI
jgi:hypothetical protein